MTLSFVRHTGSCCGGCGTIINIAYVERSNLSMRQSNGRLSRKCLSFSRDVEMLDQRLRLDTAYFNLCRVHWGLRIGAIKGLSEGLPQTPARAEGLTSHIWTLEELLRCKILPNWRQIAIYHNGGDTL